MSEAVTYADLRFARSPPEKKAWEEPNEGELTYENVKGTQSQETSGHLKDAKDQHLRAATCRWHPEKNWQTLAVLGVFLFLLSTSVGLGIQYSQVSQRLQQASQDHAAERYDLGERLLALQTHLAEMQRQLRKAKEDLGSITKALQDCWSAVNWTRGQLQHQEFLLSEANRSQDLLLEKKQRAEAKLHQATSCQQIGCCPEGWKLFRWKCLWVSSKMKNWRESQEDCQQKSSQLLVLKPWSARDLWEAASGREFEGLLGFYPHWIGLEWKSWNDWGWAWVDNTKVKKSEIYEFSKDHTHVVLYDGRLMTRSSSVVSHYICEMAASPEQLY